PTFGGNDTLTTGTGSDTVVGGIGNDLIVANFGETAAKPDGVDVVVGDNGQLVYNGPDGNLATLDLVVTINPEAGGGIDTITTGGSSDIVIGGDAGDTITANEGNNLVLGDLGSISFYQGKLLQVLSTQTGADSAAQGGADQITTGSGNDTIVGGY